MAGGRKNRPETGHLTSTEIWNPDSGQGFKLGPSLPNANFNGASMARSLDGKSLVISGGHGTDGRIYKHMYELTCTNGNCGWKKLPTELKAGLWWHATMFMPREIFNCGN